MTPELVLSLPALVEHHVLSLVCRQLPNYNIELTQQLLLISSTLTIIIYQYNISNGPLCSVLKMYLLLFSYIYMFFAIFCLFMDD